MEDTVFPSEAVAELMKEHVVESRLHTDTQNTLTEEQFAYNRRLQASIGGNTANPYFVIVDPVTGLTVQKFGLSGSFPGWPDLWIAFITKAAKKAGRL
jgi:hypothetical protein